MARNPAPLTHILQAYGVTRMQLAAVAGVDLKTVGKLCRGEILSMKVETIHRVAGALGVAPTDIAPCLARRVPRSPTSRTPSDWDTCRTALSDGSGPRRPQCQSTCMSSLEET